MRHTAHKMELHTETSQSSSSEQGDEELEAAYSANEVANMERDKNNLDKVERFRKIKEKRM